MKCVYSNFYSPSRIIRKKAKKKPSHIWLDLLYTRLVSYYTRKMCACRLLCVSLKKELGSSSIRFWEAMTMLNSSTDMCRTVKWLSAAVRGERELCEYWRNVIFSLWREECSSMCEVVREGRAAACVCVCWNIITTESTTGHSQDTFFFSFLVLLEIGVRYTCKSLILVPQLWQNFSNIVQYYYMPWRISFLLLYKQKGLE